MASGIELNIIANATTIDIPHVDYSVGLNVHSSSLKSVNTLPSSGPVYFNAATKTVYIVGNNVNLSGYDFSGAIVRVLGNNATISNSKFDSSVGSFAVQQTGTASGLHIDHCVFDGKKANNPMYGRPVEGGLGEITVTNSEFFNQPGDCVGLTRGSVDRNYFHDCGYGTDAHADAIWVGRTTGPVSITNNFIDWRQAPDAAVRPNNGIRITDEKGNVDQVNITKNVVLGGNFSVSVTECLPNYTIKNVSVTENFIAGSEYGALYDVGRPAGLVYSNNVTSGIEGLLNADPAAVAGKVITSAQSAAEPLLVMGTAGNDTISGIGKGSVVIGGEGRDFIYSGKGVDIFTYKSYSDSMRKTPDVIREFEKGIDKIDLTALDANPFVSGKQSFTWLGSKGFTGAGHELNLTVTKPVGSKEYLSVIEADSNGDKIADFRIEVFSKSALTLDDLILYKQSAQPEISLARMSASTVQAAAAPRAANDSDGYFVATAARDVFAGTSGQDLFAFGKISDAAAGTGRDTIMSFQSGVDKIDLRKIDADGRMAGDQAFDFIGTGQFSGRGHELHTVSLGGSTHLVEVDVDGDKKADMQFEVAGVERLTASDFLL